MMRALSVQQPWAFLICHSIKDIENRDWYTSYRGFLLIHAGKRFDLDAFYGIGLKDPALLDAMPKRVDYELGGIVGYATLQKVVTSSSSPWFRGKYGFVLTQCHPIPFIPLCGQLGLFDVPAKIESQINEIRDERAYAEDAKDLEQIKREWREYRLEGDEKR